MKQYKVILYMWFIISSIFIENFSFSSASTPHASTTIHVRPQNDFKKILCSMTASMLFSGTIIYYIKAYNTDEEHLFEYNHLTKNCIDQSHIPLKNICEMIADDIQLFEKWKFAHADDNQMKISNTLLPHCKKQENIKLATFIDKNQQYVNFAIYKDSPFYLFDKDIHNIQQKYAAEYIDFTSSTQCLYHNSDNNHSNLRGINQDPMAMYNKN